MRQATLFGEPGHDRDASQWFTPPWLAKRVVAWCGTPPLTRVLEPSAGGGALVREIRERWSMAEIVAYETDPRWADRLREIVDVREADFLAADPPAEPVGLCVLNPPFEGGQDLAFLRHAMRWSERVVMICRLGFIANQGTRLAVEHAGWRWIGVAVLGRVRFEGDGDTSPLSDFAAIKLRRGAPDDPHALPTLEWWSR